MANEIVVVRPSTSTNLTPSLRNQRWSSAVFDTQDPFGIISPEDVKERSKSYEKNTLVKGIYNLNWPEEPSEGMCPAYLVPTLDCLNSFLGSSSKVSAYENDLRYAEVLNRTFNHIMARFKIFPGCVVGVDKGVWLAQIAGADRALRLIAKEEETIIVSRFCVKSVDNSNWNKNSISVCSSLTVAQMLWLLFADPLLVHEGLALENGAIRLELDENRRLQITWTASRAEPEKVEPEEMAPYRQGALDLLADPKM